MFIALGAQSPREAASKLLSLALLHYGAMPSINQFAVDLEIERELSDSNTPMASHHFFGQFVDLGLIVLVKPLTASVSICM